MKAKRKKMERGRKETAGVKAWKLQYNKTIEL